ncbi:MAG: hypothetical protein GXO75_09555 [Calditrichaeota bacterium]|nr:hypothetical protein [Calditrichota bacterium]
MALWPEFRIERLRNEGKTVVLVGTSGEITGLLAVRDEIRPDAISELLAVANGLRMAR